MKRGFVRVTVMAAVLCATSAALAQSGGGFNLTGSTGSGGGGTSTGGGFILRGIVEPIAGESTGGGFTVTSGFLAVTLTCPPSSPPQPELLALPGNPVNVKNRALSIEPGNAGAQTAIRVTFDNLPGAFNGLNGQSMWAGPPTEYCENSGQTTPPVGGCGPAPGAQSLTFFASELQCSPFYTDWSVFSAVHIYGEFIVPSGDYTIQVIHEACDTATAANFSAALQLTTSIWGDSIKDCTTSPCGPPDGSVDIVTDVTAGLDKFKNVITGPTSARVDLEPNIIDQLINISDVTFMLNAFSGDPYPFAPTTSIACP